MEQVQRVAKLYGLRTSSVPTEPPKLRDLMDRCFELGYPEPDIQTGDGKTEGGVVVPMVQVQLHSNQKGKRNVVAHCQIPVSSDVKLAHRIAVRSAFAEALLLAETQG